MAKLYGGHRLSVSGRLTTYVAAVLIIITIAAASCASDSGDSGDSGDSAVAELRATTSTTSESPQADGDSNDDATSSTPAAATNTDEALDEPSTSASTLGPIEPLAPVIVNGSIGALDLDANHVWIGADDLYRVDRTTGAIELVAEIAGAITQLAVVPDHPTITMLVVTRDGETGEAALFALDDTWTQGDPIDIASQSPWEVTVDGAQAWVGAGDTGAPFSVVDLDTLEATSVSGVEFSLATVVLGNQSWIVGHEFAELVAYDTASLDEVERIRLDDAPQRWPLSILEGGGYLWAGPTAAPSAVYRFDPATSTVDQYPLKAEWARDMAFGGGHLWVVDVTNRMIEKLSVDGRLADEISIDGIAVLIEADDLGVVVATVPDPNTTDEDSRLFFLSHD